MQNEALRRALSQMQDVVAAPAAAAQQQQQQAAMHASAAWSAAAAAGAAVPPQQSAAAAVAAYLEERKRNEERKQLQSIATRALAVLRPSQAELQGPMTAATRAIQDIPVGRRDEQHLRNMLVCHAVMMERLSALVLQPQPQQPAGMPPHMQSAQVVRAGAQQQQPLPPPPRPLSALAVLQAQGFMAEEEEEEQDQPSSPIGNEMPPEDRGRFSDDEMGGLH